jgi:hypothetical protein
LERILNFIPTTATAAEKLKRLAKNLRKESGTSLAVALDATAKSHGYANWKHVTQCLEQGKSVATKAATALPKLLANYLAESAEDDPPSTDTLAAFQRGLVFAMDVKDADGVNLGDDLVECNDAWMLVAADIWRVFVHAKDDETGTALVDRLDGDDLVNVAQENLMNYRLFRYTGMPLPTSLDDAFALIQPRFFFPPTHIWLRGQFIDMEDVREIRVEGQVVYSSIVGSQVERKSSPEAIEHTTPEQLKSMAVSTPLKSSSGIIPRLDISKFEPGFYSYWLSYGGQEMMTESGFSTIREAIEAATDITGDIRGFEVAYAGVTVGTYPFATLCSSAEMVAQEAVATVAALHNT